MCSLGARVVRVSDEELRARERGLDDGDVAGRLRVAAELTRSGRRDEALAILLPCRADPAVRRVLGSFPSWSTGGDAGGSCFVGGSIGSGSPRVLWRTPFAGVLRSWGVGGGAGHVLLASPIAIVCTGERAKPGTELTGSGFLAALDPLTGERLWERSWDVAFVVGDGSGGGWVSGGKLWEPVLAIAGDVLLVWTHGVLTALDLFTGDTVYRVGAQTEKGIALASEALLVVADDKGLTAFTFPDPRVPPVRAWRSGTVMKLNRLPPIARATRDLVLVADAKDDVVALDRATGQERWRVDGDEVIADEAGLVAWGPAFFSRFGPKLRCRGLDGGVKWTLEVSARPFALGPRWIAVESRLWREPSELHFLDRKNGACLSTVPLEDVEHRGLPALALMGDGLVLPVTTNKAWALVGIAPDGRTLWRHELGDAVVALASVLGRIFIRQIDGTVTCLDLEPTPFRLTGEVSPDPPPP
jgi:outer membrane protein assembly factor BamB